MFVKCARNLTQLHTLRILWESFSLHAHAMCVQSAAEVKLTRQLFSAAQSRLAHEKVGRAVVAGCAGHAAERPWEILTTVAAALGYSVTETGTLKRSDEVCSGPPVRLMSSLWIPAAKPSWQLWDLTCSEFMTALFRRRVVFTPDGILE